jgi:hypothetical protein
MSNTYYFPSKKPTLASTSWEETSERMANRAMVHLSQGVRCHAEGCDKSMLVHLKEVGSLDPNQGNEPTYALRRRVLI